MTDPRKWTRSALLALVLAAPGAASANGGLATGAEIEAAILANDIVYDGIGMERHEPGGRILSRSSEAPVGRTSVGEWRVENDLRCVRWTPTMDWACYGALIEGDTLRFIDGMGNVSTGRLVPR
ncbi:hypothetical protein HKCCSP123_15075 [Rhodobacterales bacterium HKCCSP123]|nr:hypothetical protein [Rhodobacterales bacterium HKCCSP123]